MAHALGEADGAIEDQGLIAKPPHGEDHVVDRGEAGGLEPRAVEILVARVERNGKEAFGSPFELMLAAVLKLDSRRAMARDDIDHFFADMFQGRRFSPGWQFEGEDGDIVVPSLQMAEGAVHAIAIPMLHRDLADIDAEILDNRHALAARPVEIGVGEFDGGHGSSLMGWHGGQRMALRTRSSVSASAP